MELVPLTRTGRARECQKGSPSAIKVMSNAYPKQCVQPGPFAPEVPSRGDIQEYSTPATAVGERCCMQMQMWCKLPSVGARHAPRRCPRLGCRPIKRIGSPKRFYVLACAPLLIQHAIICFLKYTVLAVGGRKHPNTCRLWQCRTQETAEQSREQECEHQERGRMMAWLPLKCPPANNICWPG